MSIRMEVLRLKKNALFVSYIVFNAFLAFLLLRLSYGYLLVSLVVVGGHLRDVVGVIYQLINIRDLTRQKPEVTGDRGGATICCLVPVYNEHPSMLKKNLEALTTQNLPTSTKVLVLLLFDGLGEHNCELFEAAAEAAGIEEGLGAERLFQNWKSKLDTKFSYTVGSLNDTPVIVSHKETNSGKKDSLITGEKFITSEIPNIEWLGVHRVDFIYHTDGDTVSDVNCLHEMLRCLVDDPGLDGVSGLLRTYQKADASCAERAFVMMQDFQYFFSLIVTRLTESLLNSTTCLPGCCNMIRISEEAHVAIEKYQNLPANSSSLVQTVTRMQGTDRRYTTLLLKQGCNLQMNWRAFVRTEPPLDATSFVNQRRRWSSNSFFNSIVVLFSSNIPAYIRVSTLVDITRTFSTLFRFVSYLCFWIFLSRLSVVNLVFLSVLIVLPYAYAFAWMFCIVPEWKSMIGGFLLNKLLMPFLTVVAVTKMYLTSTNFAWGSTTTAAAAAAAAGPSSTPSLLEPPEPESSGAGGAPLQKFSGYFADKPKLRMAQHTTHCCQT